MVTVDITADLNDENETGFVWTFLNEARNPRLIVPGAVVIAGDANALSRCNGSGAVKATGQCSMDGDGSRQIRGQGGVRRVSGR